MVSFRSIMTAALGVASVIAAPQGNPKPSDSVVGALEAQIEASFTYNYDQVKDAVFEEIEKFNTKLAEKSEGIFPTKDMMDTTVQGAIIIVQGYIHADDPVKELVDFHDVWTKWLDNWIDGEIAEKVKPQVLDPETREVLVKIHAIFTGTLKIVYEQIKPAFEEAFSKAKAV
jgi:hypothetical protein